MMYECNACGYRFSEPEIVPEKTGVYADSGLAEVIYVEVCPNCGAENFTEVRF